MSEDQVRKVGAKCKSCGRQLTVDEFRDCSGIGHYCKEHLPVGSVAKPAVSRTPSARPRPRPTGNKRGQHRTESGAIEYSCKAQFAKNGVIKRGRLSTEHPAADEGQAVFVVDGIPYTPSEIAVLFIKDPDGRRIAQLAGFDCRA